jgi:RES domain-containing protein
MIYAADSLALAALEMLVHVGDSSVVHSRYLAFPVEMAESRCLALRVDDVPRDWLSLSTTERLKDIGSIWARDRLSLALKVPSAIIHEEFNNSGKRGHDFRPAVGAELSTFCRATHGLMQRESVSSY